MKRTNAEEDVAVSAPPRRRRARPPETPERLQKRLQSLAVQLADREHRAAEALAAQTGQPPRNRAHVTPLEDIPDLEKRLAVQKARVERLEALLAQSERKRETRAKIILGATLLAEARSGKNDLLLSSFSEILDRRLDRPRDRMVVQEMLGLPISPMKVGQTPGLPDFAALAAQHRSARSIKPIKPEDMGLDPADADPAMAPRKPRSDR